MLYFDIGAYVGDKTAEYLSLGVDKVIAVEPNPDSYQSLQDRYQDNPRVITINKAVSDVVGEADLIVPSANLITLSTLDPKKWFTGRFEGLVEAKRYKVQTTTLDRLIKKYGLPDFVKTDCEGWEDRVLMGLSVAIPRLSFEFMSEHLTQTARCLRLLQHLGHYDYTYSRGETYIDRPMTARQLLYTLRNDEFASWGNVYATQDKSE